jgi:hypothetical protein
MLSLNNRTFDLNITAIMGVWHILLQNFREFQTIQIEIHNTIFVDDYMGSKELRVTCQRRIQSTVHGHIILQELC